MTPFCVINNPSTLQNNDFSNGMVYTDVRKQVEQFGGKAKLVKQKYGTSWEIPIGTAAKFVRFFNGRDHFHVQIDLEYFTAFRPEEIDVSVSGYDLNIYANRENPNNPNYAARRLSRQYRLPNTIDVETVELERKERTDPKVGVYAKKVIQYGKPISLSIVDVNKHRRPYIVKSSFS